MRGMMGTQETRVGMRGIKVGMRGIRVGMWGMGVGMRRMEVGMRGIRVGMRGIRVGMQRIRVGMQGIRVGMRAIREGIWGIRVVFGENLRVYCFGWNPGAWGEHFSMQLLWGAAWLLVTHILFCLPSGWVLLQGNEDVFMLLWFQCWDFKHNYANSDTILSEF